MLRHNVILILLLPQTLLSQREKGWVFVCLFFLSLRDFPVSKNKNLEKWEKKKERGWLLVGSFGFLLDIYEAENAHRVTDRDAALAHSFCPSLFMQHRMDATKKCCKTTFSFFFHLCIPPSLSFERGGKEFIFFFQPLLQFECYRPNGDFSSFSPFNNKKTQNFFFFLLPPPSFCVCVCVFLFLSVECIRVLCPVCDAATPRWQLCLIWSAPLRLRVEERGPWSEHEQ